MTRFLFCTLSTIFLTLPAHTIARQAEHRPAPEKNPAFAKKIQLHGIGNAGRITDHLYRGTQPNHDGVQSLHKLGVTTIIDLRGERRSQSEEEKKQAESLGMKFLLIPGNGWSPPTDAQIAQFFAAIAQRPQQTIFIHCWFGEDRTGVFIATYRMAFEHWTPQQALAEMRDFRFNSLWHPSMIDYVRHFPGRLASSEVLAPYRALPPSATSASTTEH